MCRMSWPARRIATLTIGVAVLAGTTAAASVATHRGAAASLSSNRAPAANQAAAPRATATRALRLAGKVIGIDPGHNGGNAANPGIINSLVWNGRAWETCDTSGTATDAGYPEARFTFNVAGYLRADLIKDGAHVVMTRNSNAGVGPCVNRRARIIDNAYANVAVDIHADGGPADGRGFTIIEPLPDGPNDAVIGASDRFAATLRTAFLAGTPMPESDYYGLAGLIKRDDLAGLNLTTVPKVLIECGNMRNATDARLLTSAWFQRSAARAMEAAILKFLRA